VRPADENSGVLKLSQRLAAPINGVEPRWTMGTKNLEDSSKVFAPYTLAPVAHRIRQDVLILAGEGDHFIPLHQTADFEKLAKFPDVAAPGCD
jgi:hypothetical protein